jgi:hypothetical protein
LKLVTQQQKASSQKAKPWHVVLQLIAGGALGALLGSAVITLGSQATGVTNSSALKQELPWIIAGFLLGIFVAIGLHELGHVIAGLSQGFRFWLLVVGPLRINRLGDRIEVGWNRSVQLAGGLASCVPLDSHDLAKRMTVMVAGGPAASVLSAAALWGLGLVLPPGVRWLAFTSGLISLMIAFATLTPMQTSNFNSDGARLLMFWRRREQMERWARSATLAGLAVSTQAPRDWPASIVDDARRSIDETLDGLGLASMLYCHEVDRGDFEAVGQCLDHFLQYQEAYPVPFRPGLRLEGAWFEGAIRGRAVEARQWLNQSAGGMLIEPQTRLRAEAAVLLAEGHQEESKAKTEEARRILGALRTPNAMQMAELRMLEWNVPRSVEGFRVNGTVIQESPRIR